VEGRVTTPQAGRKIVRALKPARRGLTERKIVKETGLDETRVRWGLQYLKERGYVSQKLGGRWQLSRGSFRLNPDDEGLAAEYILAGFGADESDKGLFASIDEFQTETRRRREVADTEQRRRHAMGRKDPRQREELMSRLPNPKKKTPKKKASKKKSTIKAKAKKAGRKVKKAAKTDVGRAGIGGGIGALALGPIGAVAGAGIAIATKKKKKRKKNPARAFTLETEIKKGRQKRAKGAAGKASRASKVGVEVSGSSLRSKLAKINPGHYESELPGMTMTGLEQEHKALTSLIKRAERHPETSGRMVRDLRQLRTAVVSEKRSRRRSNPVSSGSVTDKTLAQYASNYRRKRKAHLNLVTSPGSSPGSIARAKKQLDDAERQLILYAEVRNMDPADLQRFMEYAGKKQRSAKKRKPNPVSAVKVDERSLALVAEMPALGTLGSYPRAVNMWESVYISARIRGSSKESARKQAWGAVKNVGYYQDSKGAWRMPRRRFNPGEHPKENPLKKIPRGASERSARTIISKNISTEVSAGRPQRQAVAISLASARRDSPKLMEKMYGPYPNPYLGDAVKRAKAKKAKKAKTTAKRKRKTPPPLPLSARRSKPKSHTVAATNPKKAKKKVARKTKPGWKILTDRCQKLWDTYCDKPTKKNLYAVFNHLAKMKASGKYETSKRVRDERAACLRVANKEAKRLKMKV